MNRRHSSPSQPRDRTLFRGLAGLVGLFIIAGFVLLALSFAIPQRAMLITTVLVLALIVGAPTILWCYRRQVEITSERKR